MANERERTTKARTRLGVLARLFALLLGLTLLAAACGEDAVSESASDAADAVEEAVDGDEEAFNETELAQGDDSGDVATSEAIQAESTDAPAAGDTAQGAAAPAQGLDTQALGREIIFTARLAVGVDNVAAAGTEATETIAELGGFVFGQETQGGAEPRSEIVFKVRPEDFSEALERLGGIGELRSQSITTDDVTERVVDLTSRIEVAEAGVERLRSALDAAGDLEDFARIEELLLARESDLEVMRGTLRTLRDRIDLATITLILEQDAIRNDVSLVLTAYEGIDGGALCPGQPLDNGRFEPGDDVTICFETRNVGDQALSSIEITESVLEIGGSDDLVVVAGDPVDVQPGQSILWAFETTVERDLFLRASVTAQPLAGDDGEPAGQVIRSQTSPRIFVDEDAASPGFGDGFDAGRNLLSGIWTVILVLAGFLIPLLVLLPFLLLAWFVLRRVQARREDARQAAMPPPPAPPVMAEAHETAVGVDEDE